MLFHGAETLLPKRHRSIISSILRRQRSFNKIFNEEKDKSRLSQYLQQDLRKGGLEFNYEAPSRANSAS